MFVNNFLSFIDNLLSKTDSSPFNPPPGLPGSPAAVTKVS